MSLLNRYIRYDRAEHWLQRLCNNLGCNLENQRSSSAIFGKWQSAQWLFLFFVITQTSRLQILGNPIAGWDEDFYLTFSRFMTSGSVPYVDVWDWKPIGIYLIYYPAALFPDWWGVFAYQALGMAAIAATSFLIFKFAAHLGWGQGGIWGAILYILWTILLKGHDGQTPVFYNLVIIIAAYIIVKSELLNGRWFIPNICAMILCGCALQIKYSVIFESIYFGIFLIIREYSLRQSLKKLIFRVSAYAFAGAVPTLLVAGWFFANGYGDAFIQANITANIQRGPDPSSMMVRNFLVTSALMLLPMLAALKLVRIGSKWSERPVAEKFLVGWLFAALAGFLFLPPWFDHYGLSLLMVACVASSAFLQKLSEKRRALIAFMLVVAIAGQALFFFREKAQGSAQQLVELANATGRGTGSLFIYRAPHALYWLTGRPLPTRFLFNGALSNMRNRPAMGVRQEDEIIRIFDVEKPEVVVMRSPQTDRRSDEIVAVKNLVLQYLSSSYRLTSVVRLGKQDLLVYHRKR